MVLEANFYFRTEFFINFCFVRTKQALALKSESNLTINLKMISDTKFLSQLKLVKGAIKTPKSFAHKYFIFLLNFNIYLLKRTFHSSLCILK